jgi:NAD-dependent deacetylase
MKKVAVFTGAGISQESGIPTFRDVKNGLWYNYKIEEVATREAWQKTPEKVLAFYNERRKALDDVEPNDAHKALANLEERFEVTIITQNVDDLHERGGSTNVLHLHGELRKMRGTFSEKFLYDCNEDIKIGDKCPRGSQLRPHLVLFEEYPHNIDESYYALRNADYVLVVGTGFDISYTAGLVATCNSDAKVIYVDPNPSPALEGYGLDLSYVKKKAAEGVPEIVEKIMNNEI